MTALFAVFISCSGLNSKSEILQHWNTNLVSVPAALQYLIYANGHYVAYGDISINESGAIFTSEDGQNWVLRLDGSGPSGGLGNGQGLYYTGGKFFAIGAPWNSTSALSDDGTNWETFEFPTTNSFPFYPPFVTGVAYGSGLYVAVSEPFYGGYSDWSVATSPDGKNWTPITNGIPANTALSGVVYCKGRFIAYSSGATYIYGSTSGTNWGQLFAGHPSGPISFQSDLLIAANGPGTNLVSIDGRSWYYFPTGLTNAMGTVIYSHGIFLARAGSHLATSTDGTNWVQSPGILPGNSPQQPDFATDGARLVAVGLTFTAPPSHGYAYWSDDLTSIRSLGGSPFGLAVSGLAGRKYGVDYADDLPSAGVPSWNPLTNFQLSTNPVILFDQTVTNTSQRYYRSVLLP